MINRITKCLISFVSLTITGSLVEAKPVWALTFQEVNRGILRFGNIGNGVFEYTKTPVEGSFLFFIGDEGPDTIFVTDPSQIPEDSFIESSFFISASDDFRLVTSIDVTLFQIELDNFFAPTLTPGERFGEVFLFQPPDREFFPPGPGGLFSVSTGDSRDPGLFPEDRWLLSDSSSGVVADYQVIMENDGQVFGFFIDVAPSFSGTWTAQAIPEPLTILGAGAAIGFGSVFKQQLLKKQKTKRN